MFELLSADFPRWRAGRFLPFATVVVAMACGGPKLGAELFDASGSDATPANAAGSATAASGTTGNRPETAGAGGATTSNGGNAASGSNAGIGAAAGTSAGGNSAGGNAEGGATTTGGTGTTTPQGGAGSDAGGAPGVDDCTLADIVTSALFDQLFPPKTRDALYTYAGFIDAAAGYPTFGMQGDCDTRKRDVAAFFANVAHQTAQLHYVEQLNKSTSCASTVEYAPCTPGKKYYGRGPMQLSWNYNYYAASNCLGLGNSLLKDPDLVAHDAVIAWRTGLWFWNTGGANKCQDKAAACASSPDTATCDSPHNAMASGKGFGATIDLVNGATECVDKPDDEIKAALGDRVCFYQRFVQILGTTPGPGALSCGPSLPACPR